MPVLFDTETRSRADLPSIGGRLYAEHPSTEVLCAVFYDTDTGETGAWLPGDPPPFPPGTQLGAHNAMGFDRFIAERLGWPTPALGDWIDTSELARRGGLPGALDALGTRWLGRAKDKAGSAFTKALSRPSRAKARLGQLPALTDDVMARVVAYCASDVEIMAHGWPALRQFNEDGVFASWERDVSRVDRIVNDRGVAFDSDLARALLRRDDELRGAAIAAAADACGWSFADAEACVGSPEQFVSVMHTPDATAATVAAVLADASRPAWQRALAEARSAIATIAAGKLRAGLARVSRDGRLRDCHRYYGAHTGRWSGKGLQTQNITRPGDRFAKWGEAEILAAIDAAGSADYETIEVLLRACLCAAPGRTLAVCDFSSVEARCLAWCAGDAAALETFKSGRNPYFVAAATIFGKRYEDIAKGTDEYDIGKKSELACLGGDTLVLTDRGWVALVDVRDTDLVWDGDTWVPHAGLVFRGMRATLRLAGVSMTPDHLVWSDGWAEAQSLAHDESTLRRALAIASANLPSLALSAGHAGASSGLSCAVHADAPGTELTYTTCAAGGQRDAMRVRSARPAAQRRTGGRMQTLCRMTATAGVCSIGSLLACSVVTTPAPSSTTPMAAAAFVCTSLGVAIAALFCATYARSSVGTIPNSISTDATTRAAMSQEISGSLRALSIKRTGEQCKSYSEHLSLPKPVYDLAHAGPRNRFTVLTDRGPLLVHNCGYGMGARKFEANYSPSRVGVNAEDVVRGWRELHAPIVRYWRVLEDAFRAAIAGRSTRVWPFEFVPSSCGRHVAIFLPSGRPIVYNDVGVDYAGTWPDGRTKTSPFYVGTRGFREHLYGGKIAENVIQATCRDMMAESLVRAEEAGLAPVLHVHDEVVAEVDGHAGEEALAELKRLMTTPPEWAEGFPVGAAGHHGTRYRK